MSRTSTTVGMVQRISSLSQSLTPSREKDGARYNVGCTYLESCTVDDSMLNGPPRLPEKSGDGLQDNAWSAVGRWRQHVHTFGWGHGHHRTKVELALVVRSLAQDGGDGLTWWRDDGYGPRGREVEWSATPLPQSGSTICVPTTGLPAPCLRTTEKRISTGSRAFCRDPWATGQGVVSRCRDLAAVRWHAETWHATSVHGGTTSRVGLRPRCRPTLWDVEQSAREPTRNGQWATASSSNFNSGRIEPALKPTKLMITHPSPQLEKIMRECWTRETLPLKSSIGKLEDGSYATSSLKTYPPGLCTALAAAWGSAMLRRTIPGTDVEPPSNFSEVFNTLHKSAEVVEGNAAAHGHDYCADALYQPAWAELSRGLLRHISRIYCCMTATDRFWPREKNSIYMYMHIYIYTYVLWS